MTSFKNLLSIATITFCFLNCSSKNVEGPKSVSENMLPAAIERPIAVYSTTFDKSKLLSKEATIDFNTNAATSLQMEVNEQQQYQSMEGFGASLTGSSAYIMNKYLSKANRDILFKELFSKSATGFNYLRLSMGASDFSLKDFTYDDVPGDVSLGSFSISEDLKDVVPILKEILAVNPDIKIMATPWSAPAWMKTSNSLKGGFLKPEYYSVYANYFIKYIQAMKAEGIVIDAVSLQNEPLYFTATYPCMSITATEQADIIKNHLGPKLAAADLNTKILAFDHNWNDFQYPIDVLNDAGAKKFIAGSAFHGYGGNVNQMSMVHNAHPDKGLYFTEISGGNFSPKFGDNFNFYIKNLIIGASKNWSKNILFWNLALDENYGPKNNGCQDCRGVITVSNAGNITKNEEFYALAHASAFVKYGAKRIETSAVFQLENVGFINPDGSKALIVLNSNDAAKTIDIKTGAKKFTYTIAAFSATTFFWK